MVLQGENRRWNVFWLAQHIKACIKTKIETQQNKKTNKKNSSPQGLTYALSQISKVKKKQLNKDDIYRERNGSLFLFNLFTCFNVASTCYKRAELKISQRNKKYPKLLFLFFFLRTIKSHEELTEYSKNPLKQEAPDK